MSDPLGLIGGAGSMGGIGPGGLSRVTGSDDSTSGVSGGGPSFKDVLMNSINQVNKLQKDAETAVEDLATGKRDDVGSVMIAAKKAELAFDMLQQVRNKLVDAYEEFKQMRV